FNPTLSANSVQISREKESRKERNDEEDFNSSSDHSHAQQWIIRPTRRSARCGCSRRTAQRGWKRDTRPAPGSDGSTEGSVEPDRWAGDRDSSINANPAGSGNDDHG